jgi:hypothetical protein
MTMLRTWTLAWIAALALALAACSDDSTPPPDASTQDDSAVSVDASGDTSSTMDTAAGDDTTTTDTKAAPDQATPDAKPAPDTASKPDKAGPTPDAIPPADLGPGGCISNADCKGANQYCDLPLGCTPPGTCKARPKNCTYLYDPACGCDNKTYANPCVANAAGVSIKYKGACTTTKSCSTIRTEYAAALTAAKKCSPMLTVVQCVTIVTLDLACGCQTSVNKNNAADYAKLVTLQALWKAQACDKQPWNCPKMPCKSVSTGVCDKTTSTCIDQP